VGGAQVASIRDKRIPLVSLGAVLAVEQQIEAAEQTMIVLKPAGGDVYALAVDHVHDHEELVVKPAAPVVMATGLYAGTTLADDGIPILLLDPSGIAAAAGVVLDQTEIEKRTAAPAPEEEQREETPALLFVTLGGARRAIHLPVVERIEDAKPEAVSCSAGRLRVVIGDRILPLAGIAEAPEQPFRILRLSDGVSELAYAFAEVVDIVGLTDAVLPAPAAGEVSGVTLIDGVQVEIVDSYWLFGAHGHEVADAKVRPVCALPSGDPWMENILRPIIEGAGYRVVAADSAEAQEVDVLIASAEGEPAPLAAGQIVKIRAHPEPNADHDDSIYRYDRAGLLSALSRVAGRKG
jgi:two-component system chemotaxis sensor kinase CheA